jgi:alpha-1,3-rhamnosyl/mannosyltransferase
MPCDTRDTSSPFRNRPKKIFLRFHPHLPPAKISVIYHGVSAAFQTGDDLRNRPVCGRATVCRDYFLYVGTVNPGKNLVRVLEAFDAIAQNVHVDVQPGRRCPPRSRYGDFIASGSTSRPRCRPPAGSRGEGGLRAPRQAQRALVLPSEHESFGFPVLEAFACGTPAITSNTSALPEIAGEAALLVDPYSVEEIAAACRRLANDDRLRQELIEKGRRRAQDFSWRRCAEQTLAVYEGVFSGRLR